MDKGRNEVNFDFVLRDDDTLKLKNRMCIPHVEGLRRELLNDFHNSKFTVHPRGTKMYSDMKQLDW